MVVEKKEKLKKASLFFCVFLLLIGAANTRDFSRADTAARPKDINNSTTQKIK